MLEAPELMAIASASCCLPERVRLVAKRVARMPSLGLVSRSLSALLKARDLLRDGQAGQVQEQRNAIGLATKHR